jgi:hypothetical protein
MIIKFLPIPPVIIRPTAKVDFLSAATSEDSLTLIYEFKNFAFVK